jgi:hypothetical protein
MARQPGGSDGLITPGLTNPSRRPATPPTHNGAADGSQYRTEGSGYENPEQGTLIGFRSEDDGAEEAGGEPGKPYEACPDARRCENPLNHGQAL